MSESGQKPREWHFYVRDMIEFGERVLSYTEGLEQDAFVADSLTYDATLHNLALIGEAATHIPDVIREQHPGVPWRAIVGTRNRILHAYLGIDNDVIWDIIQDAVPSLLSTLRRIVQSTQ